MSAPSDVSRTGHVIPGSGINERGRQEPQVGRDMRGRTVVRGTGLPLTAPVTSRVGLPIVASVQTRTGFALVAPVATRTGLPIVAPVGTTPVQVVRNRPPITVTVPTKPR